MSEEEELRNDYITDVAEAANLDTDQISISSVEILNPITGQYRITADIEFFDLDETAAQALVTKLNDKSAFSRLQQKYGSIESVPNISTKKYTDSVNKPKVITLKKAADGTVVEKMETIRRKTGRVRERKINPNDETDILETTEVSVVDSDGNKTRETIFKDQRKKVVKFRTNDDSVIATTDISAPDESTGDITTKITQEDGSYVETIKDSSDSVKQVTQVTVDESSGTMTTTITDSDGTVSNPQVAKKAKYVDGDVVVQVTLSFDDNDALEKITLPPGYNEKIVSLVDWSGRDNTTSYDMKLSANDNTSLGRHNKCAINSEGTYAVTSGTNGASNSNTGGAAYLWKRNADGSWSRQHEFIRSADVYALYGFDVDLSNDAKCIVVGARISDDSTAGKAFVHMLFEGQTTWETFELPMTGVVGYYGSQVSISGDGSRVLISGNKDTTSGCAYVWDFDTNTRSWGHHSSAGFVSGVPHHLDVGSSSRGKYGLLSELSDDGRTAVITGVISGDSYGGSADGSGDVWVWQFDDSSQSWGKFTQSGFIAGQAHDLYQSGVNGYYGAAVSISADGETIALGCKQNKQSTSTYGGSVYVWRYNPTTYQWGHYTNGENDFVANDAFKWFAAPGPYTRYGDNVALSADGKTLLVTGTHDTNRGTARLYQYDETTSDWGYYNDLSKTSFVVDKNNGVRISLQNTGDYYGAGASLSSNGSVALVASNNGIYAWSASATSELAVHIPVIFPQLLDINTGTILYSQVSLDKEGNLIEYTDSTTGHIISTITQEDGSVLETVANSATGETIKTTTTSTPDASGNVTIIETYQDGTITETVKDSVGAVISTITIDPPQKVYRYTFEINVPNYTVTDTSHQNHRDYGHLAIVYIKANGYNLATWDKLHSTTALVAPTYYDKTDINNMLDSTTNALVTAWMWFDVDKPGTRLFELVFVDEKITSFEINSGRPKYAPGWNIYENGVLMVSENTNRGSSELPEQVVYTYNLSTEVGLLTDYSATYPDLNGGYSVRHLYDEYTGPQVRLKRSTDNAEQDFTFDKNGVSSEFESWIGSATATVLTWYDQSGNNNHGTAVGTVTFRYDLKNLDFGSDGYFTLPDGTVPYNDDPYTFMIYHGQLNSPANSSTDQNGLLGSGTPGTNFGTNSMSRFYATYRQYWWGDSNYDAGTARMTDQVVAVRYDGSTRNIFVPIDGNGTEKPLSGRSSTASNNFIGKNDTVNNHTLNGEMYTVMIFKSAVSYDNISGISQSLSTEVSNENETLDPDAFSFTTNNVNRVAMLPITSSDTHYFLTDPNQPNPTHYNTAWRLKGDLTSIFSYYSRLDTYDPYQNHLQFTFTKPTYVYIGFKTNDWNVKKTRLEGWLNDWFGSNIIGNVEEDVSHTKGQRFVNNTLNGEINWVYALVDTGTYEYTLSPTSGYSHSDGINELMICIGKSRSLSNLLGSYIEPVSGKSVVVNYKVDASSGEVTHVFLPEHTEPKSVPSLLDAGGNTIASDMYVPTTGFVGGYVYTFEVNVLSGSGGIVTVNQLTADGNSLDTWDQMVSIRALSETLHPTTANRNINNLLAENGSGTGSYIAFTNTSVGISLIELVTMSKINEFAITFGRPKYAPGLKIYENGVLVYGESSNRGSDENPSPVSYTYQLKPYESVLMSKLQNNLVVMTQSPYYSSYNMSKAFDNSFSGAGLSGWISDDNTDSSLGIAQLIWGWVDIGESLQIDKIRLWQNEQGSPYPEDRFINDFEIAMSDNVADTTDNSYSSTNSIRYSEQSQNITWKYTNADGTLMEPTATHTFGGTDDPTIGITRSVNTGFHEFEFDSQSAPSGRYLLFRGWAVSKLARFNELQIYTLSHEFVPKGPVVMDLSDVTVNTSLPTSTTAETNKATIQHTGTTNDYVNMKFNQAKIVMTTGNVYEFEFGPDDSRHDGSVWRAYGGITFGTVSTSASGNTGGAFANGSWGIRIWHSIWKYNGATGNQDHDFLQLDFNNGWHKPTLTNVGSVGDNLKIYRTDYPKYIRATVLDKDVKLEWFTDPARTDLFMYHNLSGYTSDHASFPAMLELPELEISIYHGTDMGGKYHIANFVKLDTVENIDGPVNIELFGTGWTIVAYLPGDSSHWFPGSGNLEGYSGGEFLFTTGDNSRWLIANHDQVNGDYANQARIITKSSINNSSYTANWYHRSGNAEDPWISLNGHSNADANNNMMYGENSQSNNFVNSIHPSGMYVYTRNFN